MSGTQTYGMYGTAPRPSTNQLVQPETAQEPPQDKSNAYSTESDDKSATANQPTKYDQTEIIYLFFASVLTK